MDLQYIVNTQFCLINKRILSFRTLAVYFVFIIPIKTKTIIIEDIMDITWPSPFWQCHVMKSAHNIASKRVRSIKKITWEAAWMKL